MELKNFIILFLIFYNNFFKKAQINYKFLLFILIKKKNLRKIIKGLNK